MATATDTTNISLNGLDRQKLRAILRQSFYALINFCAWELGKNNLISEHTFYPIASYIQKAYFNKVARLHIRDPRNHLKSTIISRCFPLFVAIQQPDERYDSPEEYERAEKFLKENPHILGPETQILIASQSDKNAIRLSRGARRFPTQDRLWRWAFPETCPEEFEIKGRKRIWNATEWIMPNRRSTNTDPFVDTAGITSATTSKHYHIIIFDDPVTEQTWRSEKEIAAAIDWLELIPSLLVVADPDMPNASICAVVGNHWTYYDVSTHIEENLPYFDIWHRSCWVCENCGRSRCVRGPNCRKTSEPLWPERWTAHGLLQMKKDNPQIFAAQYENDPIAGYETAFKIEDLQDCAFNAATKEVLIYKDGTRIVADRIPIAQLRGVISLDPASGTDPRSCNSAITVTAEDTRSGAVFFLDLVLGKFGPEKTIDKLIDTYIKWRSLGLRIMHVGFEAVAGQKYVWPALKSRAQLRGVTALSVEPQGNPTDFIRYWKTDSRLIKEERITNLLGWRVESRLLYVNTTLPHRAQFIDEFTRHPVSKTNDILDALAYAEQGYSRVVAKEKVNSKIRKQILANKTLYPTIPFANRRATFGVL